MIILGWQNPPLPRSCDLIHNQFRKYIDDKKEYTPPQKKGMNDDGNRFSCLWLRI